MGAPEGCGERRDSVPASDLTYAGTLLEGIKPTLPVTIDDAKAIYDLLKQHLPTSAILDVHCFRKGICVSIFEHDGLGLKRLLVRELFAVDHESLDAL